LSLLSKYSLSNPLLFKYTPKTRNMNVLNVFICYSFLKTEKESTLI
jgi:hypothetical protein